MVEQKSEICPSCRALIAPNNDVIVCKKCKKKHHKLCWSYNKGCASPDCDSEESEEESPLEEISVNVSEDISDNVSEKIPEDASEEIPEDTSEEVPDDVTDEDEPKESSIDAPEQTSSEQASESENNESSTDSLDNTRLSDEELTPFIGKNVGFYLNAFHKMAERPIEISWNSSAFFFAPFWFVYRGMYTHGIAIAIFTVIANALKTYLGVIPLHRIIIYAAWIFAYALIAAFANCAYKNKLKQYVIPARIMPEELRVLYVAKSGGVKARATIVFGIVYLFTDFIVRFIMFKLLG